MKWTTLTMERLLLPLGNPTIQISLFHAFLCFKVSTIDNSTIWYVNTCGCLYIYSSSHVQASLKIS